MRNMINRFAPWLTALALTALVISFGQLTIEKVRAAVTQNAIVSTQAPQNAVLNFIQGTDSALTYKTLYTGATNSSKVKGVYASSSDTTAHNVIMAVDVTATGTHCASSSCYGQCYVSGLTGAANYAANTANLMAPATCQGLPLDSQGNPFIYLKSTQTLEVTFTTALNVSSSQINIFAVIEEF